MSRRIVIEEDCEHGSYGYHGDVYSSTDPYCPGGSRTVLTEPTEEMIERAHVAYDAQWFRWFNGKNPFDPLKAEEATIDCFRAALSAALFGSSDVVDEGEGT